MSRLSALRERVYALLAEHLNGPALGDAVAHLEGVAMAAQLLAARRGQEAELAAMAALMHDLATYTTGDASGHAKRGAALARELLDRWALTDAEETERICAAIATHSGKQHVAQDALAELLKDADVLHHSFYDPSWPLFPKDVARYHALCAELGLTGRLEN